MRVAICGVQVPFVHGGSEALVDSLARELRARDIQTDIVQLPFKWYPPSEVLTHALAWRLLDITESQGRPVDLVIGTKFPSYLVRHPRKVLWLFHQFRQAYDLHGSVFGDLTDSPEDERVRQSVRRMDERAFKECTVVYTISGTVSDRLRRFNGVESRPLYPPPPLGECYRCDSYGDFILSAGRLESIKRVDLLLRALATAKNKTRCVITGEGPEKETLHRLAQELGVKADFPGWVSQEELLRLYATCRAVFHAPFDEDYGFITLEAFRSSKPVLTATDAGGVLEWVTDGETGLVSVPDPSEMARLIDRAVEDPEACRRMGEAGRRHAGGLSWDAVVGALLGQAA